MTFYNILKTAGLPVAYSHFKTAQEPPYIVYLGNGQDTFSADNSFYWSTNTYIVEYIFKTKNESAEKAIEKALLDNGYLYQKSEDTYIEDQGVFIIYYYV